MITSTSNPTIKEIRKLRERKERERTGLYYLEGLRIVGEAFACGAELQQIVVAQELLVSEFGLELAQKARASRIDCIEVSAEVFSSISAKDGPQGIAAVAKEKWSGLDQPLHAGDWVALVAVQSPGNLGTILRTHDSVGGRGIILLDNSVDPYDPVVVRASMGAIFSQEIVLTTLPEFTQWRSRHSVPVIGASGGASEDYHTAVYPPDLVLLMGSERQGLTASHLAICDQTVRIPMVGRSDSLNLAVATAIILYEIFNHRRDQTEARPGKVAKA